VSDRRGDTKKWTRHPSVCRSDGRHMSCAFEFQWSSSPCDRHVRRSAPSASVARQTGIESSRAALSRDRRVYRSINRRGSASIAVEARNPADATCSRTNRRTRHTQASPCVRRTVRCSPERVKQRRAATDAAQRSSLLCTEATLAN
jgi:hypothetical protein